VKTESPTLSRPIRGLEGIKRGVQRRTLTSEGEKSKKERRWEKERIKR